MIWTLNFTMKAFFFSPTQVKKQIKFVDVDFYPSFEDGEGGEQVEIMPVVEISNFEQ